MTDELMALRERIEGSVLTIHGALREIEHALADTETPEGADAIRRASGSCYAALERLNAAANSRYHQLSVARDWALAQQKD